MINKCFHIIGIIFILYIQIFCYTGCAKEYSYEGGPFIDTIPQQDTTAVSHGFPFCTLCSGNAANNLFWNFQYNNTLLCGSITNSVITPERDGFTFFGPSACSGDTGLVMTVFLDPDALNEDKYNITTNNASLEYYDNTTLSDIFTSTHHSISFTIDSYIHSTGIARGTFKGAVTLKSGTQLMVTSGKFAIQFK